MNDIHHIPAGALPQDSRIEFFADKKNRTVFFLQNGKTYPFSSLSRKHKNALLKEVVTDPEAMADLRGKGLSLTQALEEYAFCMYGAIDNQGDINDDKVGAPENYRCSNACRCLRWRTKSITYLGEVITPRELQVIESLQSDHTNEAIAASLGMTRSTLNTHKKNLFNKLNCLSTPALVRKAIQEKIIQ